MLVTVGTPTPIVRLATWQPRHTLLEDGDEMAGDDYDERTDSRLKPPPKPVDGFPWDPARHPIDWPGWPRVRMDVRFLEGR